MDERTNFSTRSTIIISDIRSDGTRTWTNGTSSPLDPQDMRRDVTRRSVGTLKRTDDCDEMERRIRSTLVYIMRQGGVCLRGTNDADGTPMDSRE